MNIKENSGGIIIVEQLNHGIKISPSILFPDGKILTESSIT